MEPVTPDIVPPHPPLERYYHGAESREGFVRDIFDRTATDYEAIERLMALGTGSWYRRRALVRAGLRSGMHVLDVATGTGLLAREAAAIAGEDGTVLGLDPSAGMLEQARRKLAITSVIAVGESLPLVGERFDFLTLGYALRHLSDLTRTFREFYRALKPGGIVCILELTPPRPALARAALRAWVRGVVPGLARLTGHRAETALLWQYFWDTMDHCVTPQVVMDSLVAAGFEGPGRYVEIGLFSEYTAHRPLEG